MKINNQNNRNNNIKFDFSNPESQRLFEEFTIFLANITKYIEKREEHFQIFNILLGKIIRVGYVSAKVIQKLIKNFYHLTLSVIRKLINIINKVKNKLKQILF